MIFALDTSGGTVEETIEQMYVGARWLAWEMEKKRGLPLAPTKLAMMGTSAELVGRAKGVLKELGGEPANALVNLGVDFSPGKHRAWKGTGRKRRSRWEAGKARLKKAGE